MLRKKKLYALSLLLSDFLIASSSTHISARKPYNIMVADSSFAPLTFQSTIIGLGLCPLINENNQPTKKTGDCYDKTQWQELNKMSPFILAGMMDHLANQDTPARKEYLKKQRIDGPALGKLKQTYALISHGTRSAQIVYAYSNDFAQILTVRVTTTRSASGLIQGLASNKTVARAPYSNNCHLLNLTPAEIQEFRANAIQDHQKQIANLLKENPSIKVINLSLGYKKSWIAEDNPDCNPEQVSKEYDVLKESWRNLLNQFSDRLFVVAAGNENEDFDISEKKENDLWASLTPLPNLMLVGSLMEDNSKHPQSNYGKAVTLWALGNNISVFSPVPTKKSGYKTLVRGTSYSAPLVAGTAIKFLKLDPQMKLDALVRKLKDAFKK